MPTFRSPHPPATRVVLVHHDDLRLRQMSDIIASTPGFELVASESSGRAAADALHRSKPALVFASMLLPDKDAKRFVSRIRQADAAIRLVFVSPYTDRVGPRLALSSGADGYIPKSRLEPEMRHALNHYREHTANWDGRFSPWKEHYGWA